LTSAQIVSEGRQESGHGCVEVALAPAAAEERASAASLTSAHEKNDHCVEKTVDVAHSIAVLQTHAAEVHADLDDLALSLRYVGLSDDATVLADMAVKLRRDGVLTLEDLLGLSRDEMKEVLISLNLNPLQFNKVFKHVSNL
jgi:hypothetical protein